MTARYWYDAYTQGPVSPPFCEHDTPEECRDMGCEICNPEPNQGYQYPEGEDEHNIECECPRCT